MKFKFKALVSVLIAVVFVLSLCACSTQGENTEEKTTPQSDDAISETTVAESEGLKFDSVDINGVKITSDIMKDAKVVLVNLWEPWCPPCVNEMPELQKLYENYKDKGLLIIGAYTTQDGAKDIVDENGITYPIVYCDSNLLELQQSYVPASYVYDSNGKLLSESVIQGAKPYEEWEEIVLQYLE
ncbi:MAG: TlpA family protein disulfide reductase [Clostridiales bacterium]|nr:TlpA family protein disulfide reductase [Clostridiales bacterium]